MEMSLALEEQVAEREDFVAERNPLCLGVRHSVWFDRKLPEYQARHAIATTPQAFLLCRLDIWRRRWGRRLLGEEVLPVLLEDVDSLERREAGSLLME